MDRIGAGASITVQGREDANKATKESYEPVVQLPRRRTSAAGSGPAWTPAGPSWTGDDGEKPGAETSQRPVQLKVSCRKYS